MEYGNLEADQATLEHAISAARLQRFVDEMPQGLDTAVGERGLKLSGGEKQV